MEDVMGKLMGAALARVLRLFVFNPDMPYELKDVARRTKASKDSVRYELGVLRRLGVITRRSFYKEIKIRGGKMRKKKVAGWILDEKFQFLEPLRQFLVATTKIAPQRIVRTLSRAGRIKIVVIGGVFVGELESRVDLLVVGDAIKRPAFEAAVRDIEAELGKELRCATFTTADFLYRINMHDRLLRDVFDYPHQMIVDRLGVMERTWLGNYPPARYPHTASVQKSGVL